MRAWLTWLAGNLVQRGQTMVFLEDVVPEWVLTGAGLGWATALTIAVATIASCLWIWLLAAIVNTAQGYATLKSSLFEGDAWIWPTFTFPAAVVLGLMHGRRAGPVDAFRLRFPGWKALGVAIVRGMSIGYFLAALMGYLAFSWAWFNTVDSLDVFFGVTMAWGLPAMVVLGVVFGTRAMFTATMSGERAQSGALVRRSAFSAAVSVGAAILISAPFVPYDAQPGVRQSLLLGLQLLSWAGLFVALERGGYFLIRHYLARLILWRNKNAPWNYTRFLDAAADRILLRRVGGGYIFVHRMLMEYLAGAEGGVWGARLPPAVG